MEKDKNVRIFGKFAEDLSAGLTKAEKQVKDLQVKKAKPSIFIGSTTESHHIAQYVQRLLDALGKFNVDTWQMNIFGQTDDQGNPLKNAEQLKNFTDIYDFAIFIFTPDDKIVSQTRIDVDAGGMLQAKAARHNIVFEFGMFLGRIGAERSFILYENGVQDFVKLFFTDLKENLNDGDEMNISSSSAGFRIESYKYGGDFDKYIQSGGEERAFDADSLTRAVDKITARIENSLEGVRLSFLPSTSLAKGYFNNFVLSVYRAMVEYESASSIADLDVNIQEVLGRDKSKIEFVEHLIQVKKIRFYLVMPSSLIMTTLKSLDQVMGEQKYFSQIAIPTPEKMRNRSIYYLKEKWLPSVDEFLIFDIPSTLNTSIQAINLTTNHNDIRELLSEKERTNFEAMFKYFIQEQVEQYPNIAEYVRVIGWDEFKRLSSFSEGDLSKHAG